MERHFRCSRIASAGMLHCAWLLRFLRLLRSLERLDSGSHFIVLIALRLKLLLHSAAVIHLVHHSVCTPLDRAFLSRLLASCCFIHTSQHFSVT